MSFDGICVYGITDALSKYAYMFIDTKYDSWSEKNTVPDRNNGLVNHGHTWTRFFQMFLQNVK